jgi:Na+/H+ antiporter
VNVLEAVLAILVGSVVLSALARKVNAPYPALLAIAGAFVALGPVQIPFRLDPALALALFVAPVLLDAAYDTSLRDLKANWLPVGSLILVAVGLTIAGIAVLAKVLVPELPWPAAVVLGAVVAPPDAAAASAILGKLRPPHRLVVVLQGESLLNDASALLVYRVAVSAAIANAPLATTVVPTFLLSVVAALVAGPLFARAFLWLAKLVDDAPSSIILQFSSTFIVWIAAERVGLSPILTVVSYAMTVAHYAPAQSPARMRVPSYAVWDTAVLVLNALAFVLIGLQLRPIVAAAPAGQLRSWTLFAAAVLAAVVFIRIAWVMFHFLVLKQLSARARGGQGKGVAPTWKAALVISWSGMRGIVTLASGLALPNGFPQRGLLLFTAFGVTLGTLVIQGLTLRPLMLRLGLEDDRPVEREVREARAELAAAAIDALQHEHGPVADRLRKELEGQRRFAAAADDGDGHVPLDSQQLLWRTVVPRRRRLLQLRDDGTIGDDAFHQLERELDFAELAAR